MREVASKRDLVEAHSFLRRRLIRALVSGQTGGHAADQPGVARAIMGGVVVAALLVAGAAVTRL